MVRTVHQTVHQAIEKTIVPLISSIVSAFCGNNTSNFTHLIPIYMSDESIKCIHMCDCCLNSIFLPIHVYVHINTYIHMCISCSRGGFELFWVLSELLIWSALRILQK